MCSPPWLPAVREHHLKARDHSDDRPISKACRSSSVISLPQSFFVGFSLSFWPAMQHHRKLLSVLVLATWSALCVCVGDTPDEKNQRSTGTNMPGVKDQGFFLAGPCIPSTTDDSSKCITPLRLGDHCENDQSCKFFDKNTVCAAFDDNISQCACRLKYYPSITIESITRTSICIPEPKGPILKSDVPTLIGVGVGLLIFTGLTCLVLKLFSRARFSRVRGYGNANLPPPTPTEVSKHRNSYNRQSSQSNADHEMGVDTPRRNGSLSSQYQHNPHNSNSSRNCGGAHGHGVRRPSNSSLPVDRHKSGRSNSAPRVSHNLTADEAKESSDTVIELQLLTSPGAKAIGERRRSTGHV